MARRTYAQETTGPIMETNTEVIQVLCFFLPVRLSTLRRPEVKQCAHSRFSLPRLGTAR